MEAEARVYFAPRAQHSAFVGLGGALTCADIRRVDGYVYGQSANPGLLGSVGVQLLRRGSVRLDLSLRRDAVALARTEPDGAEASTTGFMGIASAGLAVVFGGSNPAARDETPRPLER